MHKSRSGALGALIVDCRPVNLFEEAEFWGAALGSTPESQEGQINLSYVRLNGQPGKAQIILQKVVDPSRVHIDIETDNIYAEVQRLELLGAKVLKKEEEWVIMEAPSNHPFCVISPIRPDFNASANVCR